MYENCRFDNRLAWCSVFTKEQLALLEYENDLRLFHESGPGHDYNSKLGCPPLKHLRDLFDKTVDQGEASPTMVAMFTHDTMMNMVFTALGYNNDGGTLRGNRMKTNRKFRTSIQTPFAGNMIAVLHRYCLNFRFNHLI
jgi:acid phosphatase